MDWLDWLDWHSGAVIVASAALLGEAWHGLCQHTRKLKEDYGDEAEWPLPRIDRLFLELGGIPTVLSGSDSRPIELYRTLTRIGRRALLYAPLARGVGRFTLAAYVIAGFAAGAFEGGWLSGTS